MRRYIIAAPMYINSSAGVCALYELQKHLVRACEDAMVFPSQELFITARRLRAVVTGFELEDHDIAVYPEVICGNPLRAKRVIRFVFNVPGLLGGETEYDASEAVFTWDRRFHPTAPVVKFPLYEPFFRNEGRKRSAEVVWVGKGTDFNQHPASAIEITRQWPPTRSMLARLLNVSSVLYTYDDATSLANEARLCGCEVKCWNEDRWGEYPPTDNGEQTFYEQFKVFLDAYGEPLCA